MRKRTTVAYLLGPLVQLLLQPARACETCVEIFTRRRGCPTKGTKEQIAAGKALRRQITAELQEHRNDRKQCSDSKEVRLTRSFWLEKKLVRWAKKVCDRCYIYAYTHILSSLLRLFSHTYLRRIYCTISSPNLLHTKLTYLSFLRTPKKPRQRQVVRQ